MEAKFARRVDESERLLAYIRSAAEVSSRMLYTQLGYLNRMTSINWGRKRELMAQVDANLQELGVDPDFIREAKTPVLNFAIWDLYAVFRGTAQELLRRHLDAISTRMREIQSRGPIEPADSEWNRLHEQTQRWRLPEEKREDMSGPTRLQNVRLLIDDMMGQLPWTEADQSVLQEIGTEIEALAADCWAAGTVTPEAEAYIERYGRRNVDRLEELEVRTEP